MQYNVITYKIAKYFIIFYYSVSVLIISLMTVSELFEHPIYNNNIIIIYQQSYTQGCATQS